MRPVHVDGDVDRLAQPPAQQVHLVDDAVMGDGGGELQRVEAPRHPFGGKVRPLRQGRPGQARNIGGARVAHDLAQQRGDGLVSELPGEVPERDVHRRQRIHVKAAGVAAHPHQIIEFVVDRGRIEGVAADHEIGQEILDDRHWRARCHDAVGLTPAHCARFRRGAHQHTSIEDRVDGAVAPANEIALVIGRLAGAERTQVNFPARQRKDKTLDAFDTIGHDTVPPPVAS